MAVAVTDSTFEQEVLKSDTPVLVDFWAEWCGPCKMIAPFVEELGKEYEGKIKIAKFDVQNNSSTPTKYGIMSIPALFFFKGGEVVDQMVGAFPKKAIEEKLLKVIG